jgi:hypothetical protein
MATVALALHVLVAVVLGWSAAAKLTPDGRRGLADMLGQLGVARHPGLAGGVLIAAEAGAAVLALVPWIGSIGAAPAAVLLAVLTAGTVVVLRRRLQVRCACFGASATVIAPIHAVRNGLLLLAAVAATGLGSAVPAEPAAVGVAILAGAVGAVVLTRLDDVAFLLAPSAP